MAVGSTGKENMFKEASASINVVLRDHAENQAYDQCRRAHVNENKLIEEALLSWTLFKLLSLS